VALFERGMARCPKEPLLAFNLAVAFEDQHRVPEALASYEQALKLAPDLADAHFNAARLYREQGEAQRALRHYSAYRRLQGK
jgi:tetratricopeptide (TPR) repeat protein